MRAALVAVLAAVALWPATRVSWSTDDPYVLAHLRSPDIRTRLFAFDVDRPSPDAGMWWDGVRYQRRFIRAVPCALMAAEVALLGQHAPRLHLVSLALHLVGVLLVFGLARRWLAHDGKAALVAAVYGIHPVIVESIGWFALQPLLVSAALSLAAIECWVRYRSGGGRAWLAAALAAVAGALGSYEATVALPLLIVAGDVLLRRGRADAGPVWPPRIAVVALLVPYLVLSVLIRTGAPELETSYRPTPGAVWTVARVDFANYVFKSLGLVDPKVPAAYWVYNALGEPVALALVAALLLGLGWWARGRPLAVLGLLAFFAFLAPPWLIRASVGALNMPSLRQAHLPLIGVCAVLTAALVSVRFRTAGLVAAPILAAFVVLDRAPRGGMGSGALGAASGPVRAALEGTDTTRPVVIVGSFIAPKRPGCGYELRLDWPGRVEMRLVPPSRSGAAPLVARTGERSFTATAADGFLIPLRPEPVRMPQGALPGFNPGGFRLLTQPPPLVRDGHQQLDGAMVEVLARDDDAIRALSFTLERPLDDYTFLAAEGCRDVRIVTM